MEKSHRNFEVLGVIAGFLFLFVQFVFWGGTSLGVVKEHCLDVEASERAGTVRVDSHWTYIVFPPIFFSAADPAGRCIRNTPLREGLAALSIWSLDSSSEQVRDHVVEQYRQGQPSGGLP